jgi:hypothetical protein
LLRLTDHLTATGWQKQLIFLNLFRMTRR